MNIHKLKILKLFLIGSNESNLFRLEFMIYFTPENNRSTLTCMTVTANITLEMAVLFSFQQLRTFTCLCTRFSFLKAFSNSRILLLFGVVQELSFSAVRG